MGGGGKVGSFRNIVLCIMARVKRGCILYCKETLVIRDQGEYSLFEVGYIMTRRDDRYNWVIALLGCLGGLRVQS